MGALTERQYGEEMPGDVYEAPCRDECRLGCGERCLERGACRLEVAPDRPSRAVSAYYDNRRGVLRYLGEASGSYAIVRTARSEGLPHGDPVAIWPQSLHKDEAADPTPFYQFRAEGVPVDGPHRVTILSLNARIEDLAVHKGRSA